jgi:hypothetical protein
MSALGQKQTSRLPERMSALPPKADIGTQPRNVCSVPKADIRESEWHVRFVPLTEVVSVCTISLANFAHFVGIGAPS